MRIFWVFEFQSDMTFHGHGESKPTTTSSVKTTSHDHLDNESPAPSPQPFSGQFLDKNESASKARNIYVKVLFLRTCLIIAAMFAVFSIYWGALSSVPARGLEGWIVVRWLLLSTTGPDFSL
jgi:hypothetical protein